MAYQDKRTKTRTRIRPNINDSLRESLEEAQNPNKKRNHIEVIPENDKDKKTREKEQSKRFTKPKFRIDDTPAKRVSLGEGVKIDQEQYGRHMNDLGRSHFAYEHDQDEALVHNKKNENIEYQDANNNQTPLIGDHEPDNKNYNVIRRTSEIDKLKENVPNFIRIKDTPGYQQRMIRQLGRTVFRTIPTYKKMEDMCREAGVDPLAQIKIITTATDTSSYHKKSIEQVASWIIANGKVNSSREDDFGENFGVMDGYRPREVVATTDDMTFLLVHEDKNSPAGEQYYIYCFQGGHVTNLENAGDKYSYETQKKLQLSKMENEQKIIDVEQPKGDSFPSPF